jgi:hypothetical protein
LSLFPFILQHKEFAMKKILALFFLTLIISTPCIGENIQEEAVESLTTAQKLVKDGNYNKAIEEINYALAKINELTAANLIKYIPEAPEGFTLVNKQSQGVGANAAIAGNAGASAEYSGQNGANVDLNIAIGGMTGKMASLAAIGSMFAGLSQDAGAGQTRQIRVQGYTGTEIYNAAERSGTLTFQVGEKTSVTIEGNNIESVDMLMLFAKKMDFSGIEKDF